MTGTWPQAISLGVCTNSLAEHFCGEAGAWTDRRAFLLTFESAQNRVMAHRTSSLTNQHRLSAAVRSHTPQSLIPAAKHNDDFDSLESELN